ncbi:TVP38/TMEM64 family membrane protein slr0305-like [Zingiber officinale]|uniref:VTT domain-containing protein n=1 Tax=Zingiber officinale TaxID=94328 RepID=A0A8J5FPN1_ZINOF|nr:TVP38/TMEM64 family membrane protein slr0305-like [Zingiber officinale]KAG6491474.1 hypothetical protein ZIOFF_052825 [Zingiber officinale]
MAVSLSSTIRISLLVLLVVASAAAFFTLPVEKILKEFLVWINQNLGQWGGPVVLTVAYIPLTILAVPAAVLSLGGGYLFGFPIGFLADSVGATIGSVAAFLLGRALGRSYVISKMKDYPDIQAAAIAIEKSGFKIVLLLRLAPLVPFCLSNYFLSVTSISLAEYTMASWLGMMPITLALAYVGTTLKELAEVTHGWSEVSIARWALMIAGLLISAVLMVCVTREAKAALQRTLAENLEADNILIPSSSPSLPQPCSDLNQPLMIKINCSNVDVEN